MKFRFFLLLPHFILAQFDFMQKNGDSDTPRTIRILSNGTVIVPIVVYIEAACSLKVGTFPFDKQSCPIPVGSLAYDFKHSYSTGSVESVSLENPGNGEWIMTNVSILSYMQSPEIQVMAPVFDLKRVPNYYVYVIALPCFVMTMLAIVGMYWTPNVKSEQLVKLSIGLTSLVSMTVLLDMLSSSIPKTSVFPLLGIYVVICVGMTSFACVIVVVYPHPNLKEMKFGRKKDEKRKRIDLASKIVAFIRKGGNISN
ncbi:unnamed protein product, partial [Mesorhabditis belari]|uniref:Uncharacterized protein n=1 Tax=Mesorhabditis belari TaxID=2138241 RepID=A0AAF3J3Q8_9BILA